ncbi:MAG: Fe-S cluster assembly ATPase SufC [Gammaproteobacteria bacterium RIFCSPHIGHO2_02_FULL_42_13]|nr:MAG: Fe-S cluster assembly ATPase SufC [Gammaproteobacteria bacterium RIFCSPHIGHO2_02_FULL_42_13]OGT69441.1 MAG: Fe-S cluster assembly ATPase SufC [Gammaproteobacteria bacterium RIFCSPLOWO2_02_FULL_42_9]
MLEIKNLHASVQKKSILKGVNLTIKPGEIHVLMGPNGSGKTTLGKVLAGSPNYIVSKGQVLFNHHDLLMLSPEERARRGLFLGFQYPVEISGVSNIYFLKAALNILRAQQGLKALDALDFKALIQKKLEILEMDESFLYRSINEGFSGGEKKRNEILQLLIFNPTLAVLDETDSGLDIDSLKHVAEGINQFHHKDNGLLLITHYQRLLNYVRPDYVHLFHDGKIKKSGDYRLVSHLEKLGYEKALTRELA